MTLPHWFGHSILLTTSFLLVAGLWGLDFGKGGSVNGASNELFFTTGPDAYSKGLFGVITAAP